MQKNITHKEDAETGKETSTWMRYRVRMELTLQRNNNYFDYARICIRKLKLLDSFIFCYYSVNFPVPQHHRGCWWWKQVDVCTQSTVCTATTGVPIVFHQLYNSLLPATKRDFDCCQVRFRRLTNKISP